MDRKPENQNQPLKTMKILTIENKAGKVRLNESVNPDSMTRLIDEIGLVFGAKAAANGADFGEITNCIENAADTLDLEIHSPGGSVLDGYKLYHALLDLRGRGVFVTATINSLAASMASVIAMGADKIRMVKGGRMMIHEASNVVAGNAEDMARAAKLLDEISGEIADIYAGKTGGDSKEIRDMMKKETWMGADEAKSKNFIDEIIDGKFDTVKKSKGMNILDRLTSPASAEALAEIDTLKAEVSNRESEVAELTNKVSVAEVALQEAATATAELRVSNETLTARVAELETIAARVPDLEAAAVVTTEKIGIEAARQLAASGHPEPIEGIDSAEIENTMTREAFNALSPRAKSDFSKSGGKITA
jgi:ATP-dependent protease ClpP protease subunit